MHTYKTFAAIAALSLGAAAAHAATATVYSNTNTFSGNFFDPGPGGDVGFANRTAEIGDEINLGPGPRFAESFRFEFYGNNFSGLNETIQLRFYQNDGTDIGGARLPATIFYDSGIIPIVEPTDPSNRGSLLFDLTFTTIPLPERFTWSIQFDGINFGTESVGMPFYTPGVGTIGFSEDDIWYRTNGVWQLRGDGPTGTNYFNFGAQLVATTVPEPSTYMLAIIGGLCGLALIHRRSRKT